MRIYVLTSYTPQSVTRASRDRCSETVKKGYLPRHGHKLQGWSHELGVVFLVYLRHGPASARAPICLFSLLGPQLGKLLEGALQAPRYVGPQHLAGLGSDNLSGVDRTPRDEDERSGQRTDLALTN